MNVRDEESNGVRRSGHRHTRRDGNQTRVKRGGQRMCSNPICSNPILATEVGDTHTYPFSYRPTVAEPPKGRCTRRSTRSITDQNVRLASQPGRGKWLPAGSNRYKWCVAIAGGPHREPAQSLAPRRARRRGGRRGGGGGRDMGGGDVHRLGCLADTSASATGALQQTSHGLASLGDVPLVGGTSASWRRRPQGPPRSPR